MQRKERIPKHAHEDDNSGGRIASQAVGEVGGTTTTVTTSGGAANLNDLGDVDLVTTPPADGDALTYDATAMQWVPAAGGGGVTDLDDLGDVNAPAPSDQDVLTWDSGAGEWIAQAGGASALDDLTDVDAPAPGDGEVLTWDDGDGEWVARSALDTALVLVAAAGSTETIDVSVARTYQITLNDDCTFTLSGAVSTESWWVTIQVHQDSPGGYEITWPGSVNWPGDVTPTPPTDPPSVSVYTLWTFDGGTTWWGVLLASSGESFVADLDDLTDVTITTPSEGNALRYRSGVWVNEPLAATGGSLVTVDPGTPSYSVVGSNVEIAHDSVWGFDGTDPYYDSAGVVAGEEAALVYDYSDDTYSIIPYTPA